MKRVIILWCFLIIVTNLSSQTWAPIGATWYYSFNQMNGFGFIKIESITDTVIQTKTCNVLQKTQYGYFVPGVYDTISLNSEYTYMDSNRVFFFRAGKFYKLYDFDAQIGTTWEVRGGINNQDSGIAVVDSIGSVVVNSDTLKYIVVSYQDTSCVGWFSAKIVERIGPINDYMFPNYVGCIVDANEGGPLRCYSDNNFPLYNTGQSISCDYITSIDNYYFSKNPIEIYPNPASTSIIIRNKNTSPTYLKIVLMSSLSQKVFEYDFNLATDFIIDISDLKTGLYFLKITNDKGYNMTKKIIKI